MSNGTTIGPADPAGTTAERLHIAGLRSPSDAVLSVRDLNISFNSENGLVHAVRGIDFDLMPGKTLGIVGESGSGKSVTSLAIMGLLPSTAEVSGSVRLIGQELLGLSD
jgi:peptide/nickel transport system ATP-binding protein